MRLYKSSSSMPEAWGDEVAGEDGGCHAYEPEKYTGLYFGVSCQVIFVFAVTGYSSAK
jgi:hypothetical protein